MLSKIQLPGNSCSPYYGVRKTKIRGQIRWVLPVGPCLVPGSAVVLLSAQVTNNRDHVLPADCNPCIRCKERPAGRQLCQEFSKQGPGTRQGPEGGSPGGGWRIIHWFTRCCYNDKKVKDQHPPRARLHGNFWFNVWEFENTWPNLFETCNILRVCSSRKNEKLHVTLSFTSWHITSKKDAVRYVTLSRSATVALLAPGIPPTALWCSWSSTSRQAQGHYQAIGIAYWSRHKYGTNWQMGLKSSAENGLTQKYINCVRYCVSVVWHCHMYIQSLWFSLNGFKCKEKST